MAAWCPELDLEDDIFFKFGQMHCWHVLQWRDIPSKDMVSVK
jgi:hypothetical protein